VPKHQKTTKITKTANQNAGKIKKIPKKSEQKLPENFL
jgi:hypothetical protein